MNGNLEVFDKGGCRILEFPGVSKGSTIDVSLWEPGLYYLKITNGDQSSSLPLIVY